MPCCFKSLLLFTLMAAMFGCPFFFSRSQTDWSRLSGKFTVALKLSSVAGLHKYNTIKKTLRFMCIHSDFNVQTPLICHNLDRNSQSEIIVTVGKLLLPFSQSSHPHTLGQGTNINTHTPTVLFRQEDGGILCAAVA